MITILHFLKKRRHLNKLICFFFFLLISLPHEFIGVSIASIFKGVSRKSYDLTILAIGMGLLIIFVGLFYLQLRKLGQPKIPLAFLVLCLGLMGISLNILIIVNIEIIHFIQYAIMAILIFPLCRNFLSTLFFVTLLGSIDEAYQYYYLSPERTNYYDFNDVILNFLGAAIGLIFLRSHQGIADMVDTRRQAIHRSTWIYYGFTIALISLLIWQKSAVQKIINNIGLPFDWENFGSVLIRKPTTGFWTEIPPKITYHVVQPVEGIVILTILLFTFSHLYYKAE